MASGTLLGMGSCLGKPKPKPKPNEPVRITSALSLDTEIPIMESDAVMNKDGKVIKSKESDLDIGRRPSNMDTDLTPSIVKDNGYELNEMIGEGSFSKVYIASRRTKFGKVKKVAVKVIRYDQVPGSWKRYKLMDELRIGKKVKHRNIINVQKIIATPRRAFIFMDLARANLADILGAKYRNGFPEKMARKFFSELISAINYLHSKGIAHRGLLTILLFVRTLFKFPFSCFRFKN